MIWRRNVLTVITQLKSISGSSCPSQSWAASRWGRAVAWQGFAQSIWKSENTQIMLFKNILLTNTYWLSQENSSPPTRKHFLAPPRHQCVCGPAPLHHVFWPTEKCSIWNVIMAIKNLSHLWKQWIDGGVVRSWPLALLRAPPAAALAVSAVSPPLLLGLCVLDRLGRTLLPTVPHPALPSLFLLSPFLNLSSFLFFPPPVILFPPPLILFIMPPFFLSLSLLLLGSILHCRI